MFAGQLIVHGGATVTVKLQVPVFLDESIPVQVTVVVPIGKQVPEAGAQFTVAPLQLSLAVGVV
jgi:hypothetical protein